jgi:hypothetical protein
MTRLPLVLNQCTEFSDPSGAIGRWSFFTNFFLSLFFRFLFLFSFFSILYSFFSFLLFFPLLSHGSSYPGHRGSIVSALFLSLSTRQSMSGRDGRRRELGKGEVSGGGRRQAAVIRAWRFHALRQRATVGEEAKVGRRGARRLKVRRHGGQRWPRWRGIEPFTKAALVCTASARPSSPSSAPPSRPLRAPTC